MANAILLLAVGPLRATTAPAFLSELQDQNWAPRWDRDSGVGQGCLEMLSRFPVAEVVVGTIGTVAVVVVRVSVVSWYYRRTAPVEHDAVSKCRKEVYPEDIGFCERGTAHRRLEDAGADGELTYPIEGCREWFGVWLDEVAVEGRRRIHGDGGDNSGCPSFATDIQVEPILVAMVIPSTGLYL